MPTPPTARDALDALGVDAICDAVSDGKSLTAIAGLARVSIGSLLTWVASDAERSARVTGARRLTSWHWDNEAQRVIEAAAADPVEMSRARELASHFRWRSSKIDPVNYGDRANIQNLDKDGKPADPPSHTFIRLVGEKANDER